MSVDANEAPPRPWPHRLLFGSMFEVECSKFAFSLRTRIKKREPRMNTDQHGLECFAQSRQGARFFRIKKIQILSFYAALRESSILKDEATGQDARATVARASLPAAYNSHVSREICRF
jgi:hypothetical protein